MIVFSDVHLRDDRPERSELFCSFAEALCDYAGRVYILGDLFEFWIGPGHARLPDYRRELAALGALVAAGVHVTFLHGNRDFLVGDDFRRDLGIRVVAGSLLVRLGGRRVLMTHGDQTFSNDSFFKLYSRAIRSQPVRCLVTMVPVRLTWTAASLIRRASRRTARRRQERGERLALPDPGTLRRAFGRGADVVVCGHFHNPLRRDLEVGGRRCALYVLGDWEERGSFLEFDGAGFRMRYYEAGTRLAHADCGIQNAE